MADNSLRDQLAAPTSSPFSTPLAAPSTSPVVSRGLREAQQLGQGVEPGRTPFESGVRAGVQGTEVGLRALGANIAEAAGLPEYAKSQLTEINQIKQSMPRGEVSNVGQIKGLGDVGDFASYTFGQALPTMATAAGGALAGRLGARSLGLRMTPGQSEFVGGALGVFPQEAGETAAQLYDSPEAMQLSPAQRLAISLGKGGITSAMESAVPTMVIGKAARGALPALEKGFLPAAKYVGKEALEAGGLEGLTELGQGIAGQAAMHLAAPKTEALLPTGEEAATTFLSGLIPGKVMGAAGAAGQLARSKIDDATTMPEAPPALRSIFDAARNPQISSFIDSLRPPADVVKQGGAAVASWISDSGQMDSVLKRAADVAGDESLPTDVRQRAADLVQSGGDPDQLQQFVGVAAAHQRGLETGDLLGRLASDSMRRFFGNRPQNDEKFNAMSVPLTAADTPLVDALTPFMRDKTPQSLQQSIPIIRDYLTAANDDPAAAMPVGMLALFGNNRSREGLRAAATMLQRMGVINPQATSQEMTGVIEDVIQRQSAWRKLIATNLAPQHGNLTVGEMNKLAGTLESLAAQSATAPNQGDQFMKAVNLAFGVNAKRALDGMQPLLPRGTTSSLTAPGAMADELGGSDTPTRDAGESAGATSDAGLVAAGLNAREAPSGVDWSFANNQTRALYDTQNPEQMGHLESNSSRLTRSGFSEAVPTGVVEYARLSGDTEALAQAKAAMPNATDAELNDRYKVLGVYKTGTPEAEQVTYDELLGKGSKWRSEYGAIKLYEPGKNRATLVTTPGKIIQQMRDKAQNLTSERLTDSESALSDFSRAISALMSVQKDGQPAFDRIEVADASGQYVPLSQLPADFSLFKGVTVGDARKALSERMGAEGVSLDVKPRKWTTPHISEMGLAELRDVYANILSMYHSARVEGSAARMDAAKARADRVRNEVRRRLERDGMDSSNESVQEALMAGGSISPTTLVPDEAANVSASTQSRVESGPSSRFNSLEAAQDFLEAYGGRGTITKQGDVYIVSDYATATTGGATTTPLESEEFADGRRPSGDVNSITPGDVEAAREGPRLFQEETGELLHPASHKKSDSLRNQLIATARRLADAVAENPASSIRSTILKGLSAATNEDVSDEAMRGLIKAAERSALLNKLIDPDLAQFQHRGIGSASTAQSDESREKALEGLKFTSVEPGVSAGMSADDKAKVTEWLRKVVPEAVVEFVEQLGGMSGSYSRDKLGKALIRINVFASDPMGVAFHEALHDLFVTLADGGHAATADLLKRVASNSVIKRKLHRLLEGNSAAQNQLSDPEEAAAYLFQFWAQGKIQLGPKSESFFDKMVSAIRRFFLGTLNDEEMALKVFTAFNEGQLADKKMLGNTLSNMGTSGYEKFASYAKPITDRLGKLTDSVDSRFRDTKNPHLIAVADKFNNAVGSEGKELGYYAAVAQARNRLISAFTESIRGTDRQDLNDALEHLQQSTPANKIADPEVRKIVDTVRDTLNKLYSYMNRKGVRTWDNKPVGYIKDYFPRLWDVDKLVADGDKFIEDLLAHHKDKLAYMAQETNSFNAKHGISAQVDERAIAEALLAKLTRNSGAVDDATSGSESALKEMEAVLGFTPAMNAANERVLKFLDMTVFSKYLQKDLVFAMTQYINQAVKRAEYSERFGSDGGKLEAMLTDAERYEVAKRVAANPKADVAKVTRQVTKDFETYRTGVMALEGTLGHDISPELRQFNSAMMTYQNLRTIPLALLSSFIDPLGIMVRGGEMKHAYKAFTRGLAEVVKSWKGEMSGAEDKDVALAELLGTLEPSSYLDSLGQTYGSMYVTGTARRVNDIFFRMNGMEGWNRAMRTQATLAAIDFIKKLKTEPDQNTERYLKELGLTENDIVLKSDGSLDLSAKDKRLQFAIMRWVDGAVLRPNASQRPAWASNPKYALLFHLNQFTYSFHKVILERMYHEAKNGNYDPLMVAAAGYVPVMLAANIIRAYIQGGGEEPDWMKGQDSLFDWVVRAVQGAGLNGVPGAIAEKFPTGLAGPTVQQALDAVFKDKDLTTTLEKSLPFQSIYRHW